MTPTEVPVVIELDTCPTLTQRFRVAHDAMGAKLGEVLPAVFQYALSNGAQIAGPPFSRYHEHDAAAGEFDLEAGIIIASPIPGEGDIQPSELPGGRAVSLWHIGPYHQLGASHSRLAAWIQSEGLTPSGGPWESYVTDPSAEPDPANWKTQLFQPIQD